MVGKHDNYVEQVLNKADKYSLEYRLNTVEKDCFYYPTSALPQKPFYIRHGQYNLTNQANIIYPRKAMEGIIFIKTVYPVHIINGEQPFHEKYNKLMDKFNFYESLIKM
ncbi:hypothetical protein D0T49_00450 [Paludibacter sp. 221]|nr:hypothetical protein [Paludibacter sp. 221]